MLITNLTGSEKMSEIKKRICKEKDCGGELEFLGKIDKRSRFSFWGCTKCKRVSYQEGF